MTKLWFGTRGHETWIDAPSAGVGVTDAGYSATTAYLNGWVGIKNSIGGHLEYAMSWDIAETATIRLLRAFATGVFGAGLVYFIDPTAVNVFPQHWATPSQCGYDAPPLVLGQTPTLTSTAANAHGFPAESVTYTLTGDDEVQKLYIPIPPGETLQVGFTGSATGTAAVAATTTDGTTDLTLLAGTDTALTNASFTGWVEFALTGIGTITLTAATAILAADAVSGDWMLGEGNSGCVFDRAGVQVTSYAADTGLQGMTATLIEQGAVWSA